MMPKTVPDHRIMDPYLMPCGPIALAPVSTVHSPPLSGPPRPRSRVAALPRSLRLRALGRGGSGPRCLVARGWLSVPVRGAFGPFRRSGPLSPHLRPHRRSTGLGLAGQSGPRPEWPITVPSPQFGRRPLVKFRPCFPQLLRLLVDTVRMRPLGLASSASPDSSGVPPAMYLRTSWKVWLGRSSSTRPNRPTSSISFGRPTPAAPGPASTGFDRRFSASSMPWPKNLHRCATAASTASRPIDWAPRTTHRSSMIRTGRQTWPGSPS